jgi:phage tail-like protein
MATFPVNKRRFDPYKSFKFRVKWDGRYVAGVSRISPLKRTTDIVEHREGSDPHAPRKSPGRTIYEAITLERGVTHDSAFEDWANMAWSIETGGRGPIENFRKDLVIELLNEEGIPVIAYKVYRCWVSEYQALPELDESNSGIGLEYIKVENEGWERDASLIEPQEI